MKAQGVSRDTLPWKSPLQPYTAWVGFIGASIITLITGYPVFLKGRWNASTFVASYIGIPIFIVPIMVWKLIHRTKVGISPAFLFFCFSEADLWNCSLPVLPLLIYGPVVSSKARSRTRRSRPRPFGDALLTGYSDIEGYTQTYAICHTAVVLCAKCSIF
jgi:amino acid transporter